MQHKSCLNCRFVNNQPTHIPKCERSKHPHAPFFSLTNIVINDPQFYCSAWELAAREAARQKLAQGSQPSDTVVPARKMGEIETSVVDELMEMTKDVKPLQ